MPFYKGVPGVFAGDTCARGPIREAILLCVQVYGPWTMARQGVKGGKCVKDVKKVSWATVHGGNAHKACAKPDEP